MLSDAELLRKFSLRTSNRYEEEKTIKAAVLVPLVDIDGQDHLLFQVRSSKLRWQPGDISFPGGKFEDIDENAKATAIRECMEELGITRDNIQYIGDLDRIISPIGVQLHPIVGRLTTRNWQPNSSEVAELFTVPLDFLLAMTPQKAMMDSGTRPKENFPFHLLPHIKDEWRVRRSYEVYFYPYENHVIWGLTALVLKNFLDIYRN